MNKEPRSASWFFYFWGMHQPIGIFDSGYGGLTVLKEIQSKLPGYDYIYLGDNARAPYGNRSFATVYEYTLECVDWFFDQGCSLVVLACNTASAKALRTIQQVDLPKRPGKKVLGVIRPTTEIAGQFTKTGSIGVLATTGTVLSGSYDIEIKKFFPGVSVYQQACPMWVPLIENNEHETEGADYFTKKYISELMNAGSNIDAIVLACTHYPLLENRIRNFVPDGVTLVSQGLIVATSLKSYLERHPEVNANCSVGGSIQFYTTDSPDVFDSKASIFYGAPVRSVHVAIS